MPGASPSLGQVPFPISSETWVMAPPQDLCGHPAALALCHPPEQSTGFLLGFEQNCNLVHCKVCSGKYFEVLDLFQLGSF